MAEYEFRFPRMGRITLLSVWVKGKRPKLPEDHRFLVRNEQQEEEIIWLSDHALGGLEVDWTSLHASSYKSTDHIKNRSYNYYLLHEVDSEKLFDEMIKRYIDSDPWMCLTGFVHQRMSDLGNVAPIVKV